MKRGRLLNRHLSTLIASLGHLDEIVIADAGLPVPAGVTVIDLAVSQGIPSFWDVVQAVRSELIIEAAVRATETPDELAGQMTKVISAWAHETGRDVTLSATPHETLKGRTRHAKAVIRTGEFAPYCNLILVSGVAF